LVSWLTSVRRCQGISGLGALGSFSPDPNNPLNIPIYIFFLQK
jgi:hypothetical protein